MRGNRTVHQSTEDEGPTEQFDLPFTTLSREVERVVGRLGERQDRKNKTVDCAGHSGAKNNKDHGVSPRVSALYGPRATRAEFAGRFGKPKVRRE